MPEHSVITDPNIHEPKGISTANSGEVYVADGAGSGAWTAQASTSLPTQTGNGGKLLTTNGTAESWSGDSSVRARATITGGTSIGTGAVNVASTSNPVAGIRRVTFTTPLASANYQVFVTQIGSLAIGFYINSKTTTYVDIAGFQTNTGGALTPTNFDVVIYGGF